MRGGGYKLVLNNIPGGGWGVSIFFKEGSGVQKWAKKHYIIFEWLNLTSNVQIIIITFNGKKVKNAKSVGSLLA